MSKLVLLFEAAGKREKKSIPTLLLQGKSGAGKTFLAETFSKMIGAEDINSNNAEINLINPIQITNDNLVNGFLNKNVSLEFIRR